MLSSFISKFFKNNKQIPLSSKSVSINEEVEILGNKLELNTICKIVETSAPRESCTYVYKGKERFISRLHITQVEPTLKINGLHVLDIYECFPCFDEHDYDNESRYYHYYFFSRKKFTDKKVSEIMLLMKKSNIDDYPKKLRPAVYYSDGMDTMIVAL